MSTRHANDVKRPHKISMDIFVLRNPNRLPNIPLRGPCLISKLRWGDLLWLLHNHRSNGPRSIQKGLQSIQILNHILCSWTCSPINDHQGHTHQSQLTWKAQNQGIGTTKANFSPACNASFLISNGLAWCYFPPGVQGKVTLCSICGWIHTC